MPACSHSLLSLQHCIKILATTGELRCLLRSVFSKIPKYPSIKKIKYQNSTVAVSVATSVKGSEACSPCKLAESTILALPAHHANLCCCRGSILSMRSFMTPQGTAGWGQPTVTMQLSTMTVMVMGLTSPGLWQASIMVLPRMLPFTQVR